MTLPPLASLFPGVNEPVASDAPAWLAAELVPFTGLVVATLLSSLMVYWNGWIDVPKVTVSVVWPAFAFGNTKIAEMLVPGPPSADTAGEAGQLFPLLSEILMVAPWGYVTPITMQLPAPTGFGIGIV